MSMEQCAEITLKTEQVGDFKVTIQEKGDSKKLGSLVTIHDIGLNSTSYLDFFNNEHNLQVCLRLSQDCSAPASEKALPSPHNST